MICRQNPLELLPGDFLPVKCKNPLVYQRILMMRVAGLEPARLIRARDFKSLASRLFRHSRMVAEVGIEPTTSGYEPPNLATGPLCEEQDYFAFLYSVCH